MSSDKVYIAIDLKSFYASVECIERKLNPMTTNLVVADMSRTEKTIGLAVSPSLKSFGIPGRPRLFEVVQKVKEVNNERRRKAGKTILNEKMQMIVDDMDADPIVTITYFVPDKKKKGGAYVDVTGIVKEFDEYERCIVMTDKNKIPIEQVSAIEGDLFSAWNYNLTKEALAL